MQPQRRFPSGKRKRSADQRLFIKSSQFFPFYHKETAIAIKESDSQAIIDLGAFGVGKQTAVRAEKSTGMLDAFRCFPYVFHAPLAYHTAMPVGNRCALIDYED